MENLKPPRWPDEASDLVGGGGLLDGHPAPVRGSGLDFLFGATDGQGGLTIGQVDPGALVLGRPRAIIFRRLGQRILSGRWWGTPKPEGIPGGQAMTM